MIPSPSLLTATGMQQRDELLRVVRAIHPCRDHRETGGRAWCFDCREWCYGWDEALAVSHDDGACMGCLAKIVLASIDA